MKILHTADWHLGKTLYKYELNEDIQLFFEWLLNYISQEKIDVLLVAGDIFDMANPSNKDLKIYYDLLIKLHLLQTKVIIIGGNHDSISLLEAPKDLLNSINIHVIGGVSDQLSDELIPIFDSLGKLHCVILAVPFLRDRDLRKSVDATQEQNKSEIEKSAIKLHYDQLLDIAIEKYGDQAPIIAMGHLHLQGAETSDSEREIHIGNLEGISASMFSERIDYIALGHIHKPQKVGNSDKIQYSGSPIFLDFSERNYDKRVIQIEIEDQKIKELNSVKIPKRRALKKFVGSFQEVEYQLMQYQPEHELTSLVELEIIENQQDPAILKLHNDLLEATPFGNYKIIKSRLSFKNNSDFRELLSDNEQIMNFTPLQIFKKRLEMEQLDEKMAGQLLDAYQILIEEIQD